MRNDYMGPGPLLSPNCKLLGSQGIDSWAPLKFTKIGLRCQLVARMYTKEYTECQAFFPVVRIGPLTPSTARDCCSSPMWFQGGDTLAHGGRLLPCGGANYDEGTDNPVLYVYYNLSTMYTFRISLFLFILLCGRQKLADSHLCNKICLIFLALLGHTIIIYYILCVCK